jgi:hypothetical protein
MCTCICLLMMSQTAGHDNCRNIRSLAKSTCILQEIRFGSSLIIARIPVYALTKGLSKFWRLHLGPEYGQPGPCNISSLEIGFQTKGEDCYKSLVLLQGREKGRT